MSGQNPQEPTPLPALWDSGDVPIHVPEDCTWGIPKEMMTDVWRLLEAEKAPASNKGRFSLEDFQHLVSFLYLKRSDEVSLVDAIREEVAVLERRARPPKPEKLNAFNDTWILIAGISRPTLPDKQIWIAEALAIMLAKAGYALLHGGSPGIDEIASAAFSRVLLDDKQDGHRRMRMFVTEKPAYTRGQTIYAGDFEDWKNNALTDASAVILISGGRGTYSIYKSAIDRGIPVIPIKDSGGDADVIFRELTDGELAAPYGNLLMKQPGAIESREDALVAADIMENILVEILKFQLNATRERFIAASQKEERRRESVYVDDVQRGRWGRSAESNGYRLSAALGSTAGGEVKVTLSITRLQVLAPAKGWVIFYYQVGGGQQQLKLTSFNGGAATIEFNTRHACTVGAYLEDTTVLELDLNTVPGAKDSFYYTSPPDSFRELVSGNLRKRKVKVKNDIQKNRWGNKRRNNGNLLNARVTTTGNDLEFEVTLEVVAESPRQPLTGWVAFFLPHVQEVVYYEVKESTKGGVASITIDAEEAFTAGAMTQDGTLLELDLQEVPGFPSEFYYEKRRPTTDRPNPNARKQSKKKK